MLRTIQKIALGIGAMGIVLLISSAIISPGNVTDEDSSGAITDETLSKYEGLSQSQIAEVQVIEDSCESKAASIYAQEGAEAEEVYSKKCNQNVNHMIEGFQKENLP